jgi:DNA polymerase-3 subunit epsilon
VTKKVALLVAADPDSLSGKAREARDYGIPIVGEAALARPAGEFPLIFALG